jgi:hypothetical protein
MTTLKTKPVIFISDSPLDEPEKPRDGDKKWLSFVNGFLKSAKSSGDGDAAHKAWESIDRPDLIEKHLGKGG